MDQHELCIASPGIRIQALNALAMLGLSLNVGKITLHLPLSRNALIPHSPSASFQDAWVKYRVLCGNQNGVGSPKSQRSRDRRVVTNPPFPWVASGLLHPFICMYDHSVLYSMSTAYVTSAKAP